MGANGSSVWSKPDVSFLRKALKAVMVLAFFEPKKCSAVRYGFVTRIK